jgi:hypothetical protein
LTKRPRALVQGWDYPVICATNLARMRGDALVIGKQIDLDTLRLRVVVGTATFEELRAWVAERLHPRY